MRNVFSENLLFKLRPGGLVEVVEGRSGAFIEGDSWLLAAIQALHPLKDGFVAEDFVAVAAPYCGTEAARAIFEHLKSASCIVEYCEAGKLSREKYSWNELGWGAAKMFFESVVDTQFVSGTDEGMREQQEIVVDIASQAKGPPAVKQYPSDFRRIPLSTPPLQDSRCVADVLLSRRTVRNFSHGHQVSLDQLSLVLHLAARSHGLFHNPMGPHLRRSSPSGGARHPVEVYPQLIHAGELSGTSCYYDSVAHELVVLGPTDADQIYEIGQKQTGCTNVPFALLLTLRFSRNLWKYRYAKSFLFSWLDLGHLAQSIILAAESVGFRSFLTPALDVPKARSLLNLSNSLDEIPAYLLTFGRTRGQVP